MQRRGNLPLIILSFKIPTCKVVIPKVDRHEMTMYTPIYFAANTVAISRDDIIYYCNFRRNASGNSRYGCAIMLQETVVTTALRLNFELNVQRHILNFEFSAVYLLNITTH